MLQTFEAIIDEQGNMRRLESVQLPRMRRAFVAVFADEPTITVPEIALLSEAALAEDWNRPGEDAAWSHLQQVQSFWRWPGGFR